MLDICRTDEIAESVRTSFNSLFYIAKSWQTEWCGVPVPKCPFDLFVIQQIIWVCRPDVIIETGTAFGGSALFYAMILDRLGGGRVISVDTKEYDDRPDHPRLEYVCGSSTDSNVLADLKLFARGKRTMVLLDSEHSKAHVLDELAAYAPFVTPGQYFIVEDTNLNGHPVMSHHGPGPYEAVEEFLPTHPEFVRIPECEYLGVTFNPGGFLYRRTDV